MALIVSGLLTYFGMPSQARSVGVNNVTLVKSAITFPTSTETPDPNIIFDEVNALRNTNGLQALIADPVLLNIAGQRADDMVAQSYYAHKNPDGLIFYDIMKLQGTAPDYACENLALESSEFENVFFESWNSSDKGHKECMLSSRVTRAGYAVRKLYDVPEGGELKPYYVVVAIHASEH